MERLCQIFYRFSTRKYLKFGHMKKALRGLVTNSNPTIHIGGYRLALYIENLLKSENKNYTDRIH